MAVMTSQVALKEWAVVVEAIARGRHCLLLRKGGVADPDETFELAHREFFLFPTFEHQKRDQVRAEFHPLFDEVVGRWGAANGTEQASRGPPPTAPPMRMILLPLYAGVAGHWRVESPDDLRGLERLHIWTPEFLAMRLAYKPEIPTLAVLVRAYRLPAPPAVPNLPRYAGCRSWVPLDTALPVEGAVPAIENQAFRRTLEQVSAHLQG